MREWAVAALDLVFPARCPVCDTALGPGRRDPLCGPCWDAVERVKPPLCAACGLPSTTWGAPTWPPTPPSARRAPDDPGRSSMTREGWAPARELCGACAAMRPGFDWARAGGVYGGTLREAIQRLKFARRPALARPLAALIVEQWGAHLPRADALLPVPLARARERLRGFNQAEVLAERVAAGLGLPLRSRWLARARDTAPQTDLDVGQRRTNVRGAFVASSAVAGLDLVLVDDVLTTGATASECARVLRAAGAGSVGVLTVARVL